MGEEFDSETGNPGFKSIPAVKVTLVREGEIRYWDGETMGPGLLAKLGRKYIGKADREHFVMACLDANYKISAINTVSIGELNGALVHPREIIKVAVLANSHAIALMHNHPGGNPQPSAEDEEVTDRIKECMELIGIHFLDHIVIGDRCFYSFAASRVMKMENGKKSISGQEIPCNFCGKGIASKNKLYYLVIFGRLQVKTSAAELKCPRCGRYNILPDLVDRN